MIYFTIGLSSTEPTRQGGWPARRPSAMFPRGFRLVASLELSCTGASKGTLCEPRLVAIGAPRPCSRNSVPPSHCFRQTSASSSETRFMRFLPRPWRMARSARPVRHAWGRLTPAYRSADAWRRWKSFSLASEALGWPRTPCPEDPGRSLCRRFFFSPAGQRPWVCKPFANQPMHFRSFLCISARSRRKAPRNEEPLISQGFLPLSGYRGDRI